ncbi:MAG TPA: hypothetical protein VMS73_10315 [Anaerolineaceae bacterium]|nr:hypothetical protein [Anaerolineaceae bacterium]
MKAISPILIYAILVVFAVTATILSSRYVNPPDCRGLCDPSSGQPCPAGTCLAGQQKAGLPMPYLVDDPGGSSPTSGWGILGPEDLPNPLFFLLDVLFFGQILWLGYILVVSLRRQSRPDLLLVGVALAVIIVGVVSGILLYRV